MKFPANKGFDPEVIKEHEARIKASGRNFLTIDADESNDEYQHFYFVGKYKGRVTIFDAVVYTLRLHHQSELFELAEQKAIEQFPHYRKITSNDEESGEARPADEQEEEIGLFLAEVIAELEEEGEVKVKEHLETDSAHEFGIGLDAGLNVERITPELISKLIRDFNAGTLILDETLVTFETEQED
jgi:hypothetical protein